MKFKDWYTKRGLNYLFLRAQNLLSRYQISPSQAIHRIDSCLEGLVDQGCAPSFPTPGIIVQHHPQYFRHIQEIGAEIAVHGYQHVDLSSFPIEEACRQLAKAVAVFNENGIEVHGFRCPYIGCTNDLVDAIPQGLFEYSSNQALYWNVLSDSDDRRASLQVDTLRKLYNAKPSKDALSLPWMRPHMVEIPISMPDDMELLDGLKFGTDEVAGAWGKILQQTHQQGELFNVIFHPELALLCEQPFMKILGWAKLLEPKVWVARLCDISTWWYEKASFKVDTSTTPDGLRLMFACSPRATILTRGIDLNGLGCAWEGGYQRLNAQSLMIPASPRPFIGLSPNVSKQLIVLLQEQGYILDLGDSARDCGIYLTENILGNLKTNTQVINYIEESKAPLVRFWRWPDGAKSALCITGDLDALSLMDYAQRIFS